MSPCNHGNIGLCVQCHDEDLTRKFLAMCERTGRAEKVRETDARSMTHVARLVSREQLANLGLTAILTKPETCATCGGTRRLMWTTDQVACPDCGGADDD